MASIAPVTDNSVFFRLPLEIRQQIYGYCIPQNMRFYIRAKGPGSNMWEQNRPRHHPGHSPIYTPEGNRDKPVPCTIPDCVMCDLSPLRWRIPPGEMMAYSDDPHHGGFNYRHPVNCIHRKPERPPLALLIAAYQLVPRPVSPGGLFGNPFGSEDSNEDHEENAEDTMVKHPLIDDEGEASVDFDDYCYECLNYYQDVPANRRSALPGLLLACRQINDEVETLLYGNNTFIIDVGHEGGLGQRNGLGRFSPQQRTKMRKIVLNLSSCDFTLQPKPSMDTSIWNDTLCNLAVLGLVTEETSRQHLITSSTSFLPTMATFRKWEEWLKPIVEHIRGVAPRTIDILLSGNGAQTDGRTAKIVEEVMPGRCRLIKLDLLPFVQPSAVREWNRWLEFFRIGEY